MATQKSIPIAPVLRPAADALPDLAVLTQNAVSQSKTLDECILRLESSLAPYADSSQPSAHRLVQGLLAVWIGVSALTAAAAKDCHGR